jgi:hypothetical protein
MPPVQDQPGIPGTPLWAKVLNHVWFTTDALGAVVEGIDT